MKRKKRKAGRTGATSKYSYRGWRIRVYSLGGVWHAEASKGRQTRYTYKANKAEAVAAIERRVDKQIVKPNPSTNWLLIGGGAAVLGIGAYFIFRKPTPPALTP